MKLNTVPVDAVVHDANPLKFDVGGSLPEKYNSDQLLMTRKTFFDTTTAGSGYNRHLSINDSNDIENELASLQEGNSSSDNLMVNTKTKHPYKLLSHDSGIESVGKFDSSHNKDASRSISSVSSASSSESAHSSSSSSVGLNGEESSKIRPDKTKADNVSPKACYDASKDATKSTGINTVAAAKKKESLNLDKIDTVPNTSSGYAKCNNGTTTTKPSHSINTNASGLKTKKSAFITVDQRVQQQYGQQRISKQIPPVNSTDEPAIDPRLINKKDGLEDCMYYLDEFGSPKLRSKYLHKKMKELRRNGDGGGRDADEKMSVRRKKEKNEKIKKTDDCDIHSNNSNRNNDSNKDSSRTLDDGQGCVNWSKLRRKFKNALSKDGSKITTVVATPGQGTDRVQEVSYTDTKIIGNGSFGVVFQARLCDTGEMVAIKKVLQDRRFKNRELQIMRKLEHCNIVKLKYFFYSSGEQRDEVFLNLVLEYIPETVYKVARQYAKTKQTIPINFIRLYMYQLFRSLAYIHSMGICHRDIKPQNLLLDPETAVLKLCDFGSAKQLLHGEPNVSYICSRYYRAPELIFGAINYTTKIDVWSAGCVLAELLLGQPIFPGDSGVDQLVEVIKVLGTPTREQIREMNPNYTEFKFPQIKSHPWQKVFRTRTPPEAINLVSRLLEYTPSARITPLQACAHPFFNELREEVQTLPNGKPFPPLFNFTEHELSIQPSLIRQLLPRSQRQQQESNDVSSNPAAGGAAGSNLAGGNTSSGSATPAQTGGAAPQSGTGSQSSLGANAAPGTAQTAANASSGGSGAVQTDAGASQTAAGGTQIQTTSTMG
ncbi:unnamed protein product [Hermetia illucens]|uniref:Protein kinase domain-containing protein n=1 Tax=Hermetia illucens TaxID=343691 RepID=A0A7R8UUT6_HERIL|nr:protein kinase shaggy-like isoform X2 [Hermetia illucens]CAD7087454.1 unnamed protein product [Hermetia illucens]